MKIISTSDNRTSFNAENYKFHNVNEGKDYNVMILHVMLTDGTTINTMYTNENGRNTCKSEALKSSKEIIDQLNGLL